MKAGSGVKNITHLFLSLSHTHTHTHTFQRWENACTGPGHVLKTKIT